MPAISCVFTHWEGGSEGSLATRRPVLATSLPVLAGRLPALAGHLPGASRRRLPAISSVFTHWEGGRKGRLPREGLCLPPACRCLPGACRRLPATCRPVLLVPHGSCSASPLRRTAPRTCFGFIWTRRARGHQSSAQSEFKAGFHASLIQGPSDPVRG